MKKSVLMGLLCFISANLHAQNPTDAARYFDQIPTATGANFNTSGSFGMIASDFGSIAFNPAMSALFKKSYADFSMSNKLNRSETAYLSNSMNSSENYVAINSFSSLFKFPTLQGSFALSIGYVQTGDFANTFTGNGFNTSNSISDYLAQTNSGDLRLIGYNGYATDSVGSELQSVLRFNNFNGIDQYIQQNEAGQRGDFIINTATEFQKDMFVGVSIGFPIAEYHYERIYLEDDVQNLYKASPFDVSSIFASEKVNASVVGIYAKFGLAFKPVENLQVGISYQTPYTLEVNENYSYLVTTDYDDGFSPSDDFVHRLNGDFSYRIDNPAVTNVGIALQDLNGLSVGFTAEYRNFNALEFKTDPEFKRFEIDQNRAISNQLKDVINMSLGLGYSINQVKYQLGFAYNPTPLQSGGVNTMIYSAGIEAEVSTSLKFFAGLRYQSNSTNRVLYNTLDYGTNPTFNASQSFFTTHVGVALSF